MGGGGQILPKYRTGLCAKCQRKVGRTIKQARWMGFLPYIQEPLYLDMRRYNIERVCKGSVDGKEVIHSKTI